MPIEPTRKLITPAATHPDGAACVAAVLIAAALALGGSIVAFAAEKQ